MAMEEILQSIFRSPTLENFRKNYFGVTRRNNLVFPNIFTTRHFENVLQATRDYRSPITEPQRAFVRRMLSKVWTPVMLQFAVEDLRLLLEAMQIEKQEYITGQFKAPHHAVQHIVYLLEAHDLC